MVQASCLNRFTVFKVFFVFLILLHALSGCGGGGGSSKPSLSIEGTTVTEGDAGNIEMSFTVTLSEDAAADLTLSYHTADGSAEAAKGDYTQVDNGTLTIAKGSRTANASIPVYVNGDDDFEADETIQLIVNNAQGVSLDQTSYIGTGTITNDDDADRGYFAGTATLNGNNLTDLIALAYNSRILLFSPSVNVLYDIKMSNRVEKDYSGTVDIYVDGVNDQTLNITGQTNGLYLTGSFSDGTGSGFGEGSFSVTYDLENNKGATLARIDTSQNVWTGTIYGIDKDASGMYGNDSGIFIVNVSGLTGGYVGTDDHIERCAYGEDTPATLDIPDPNTNIFKLLHAVEYLGFGTCNTTYESTGHTGFAAVINDAGIDDKLIYAFNNGTFALFAIMHH